MIKPIFAYALIFVILIPLLFLWLYFDLGNEYIFCGIALLLIYGAAKGLDKIPKRIKDKLTD